MNPNQKAALDELTSKTLQQIQIETAYKWAYRAWAAYTVAASNIGVVRQQWLSDALEYEHEAVEHAALADEQGVLEDVRLIVASGKRMI